MSTFLRDILNDVPVVDRTKTVVAPDVVTSDLETFFGFIFADQSQLVGQLLFIDPLIKLALDANSS